MMKRIQHYHSLLIGFLKKHSFRLSVWGFFLFLSLAVLWQFLLQPTFSLIDDGYSLTKGHALVSDVSLKNWSETLVESHIGRFRPVYMFYFSIVYVLFGAHPIGLWFFQAITLWLTLGMLFEILILITQKKSVAILAPVVWLIMPTVAENIFRMGPTEPRQLLFALLAIFWLLRYRMTLSLKQLAISCLFTILAIGTKETSVLLLLFYGLVAFEKKVKVRNWWTLVVPTLLGMGIFIALVFLGLRFIFTSGYAIDNFGLNTQDIVVRLYQNRFNFAHYYLLLWVGLVSLGLRLFASRWLKTAKTFLQKNMLSFSFLTLTTASLFFMIAWAFQFERYFYLPWTFIFLFLALELTHWIELSRSREASRLDAGRQAGLLVSAVIGAVFGYYTLLGGRGLQYGQIFMNTFEFLQRTYDVNQMEQAIVSPLLLDDHTMVLYTTNDDYEVVYELGLYLSQFGARPVTVVSPNQELANAEAGYEFHENPIEAYSQDERAEKILVGRVVDIPAEELPADAVITQPQLQYEKVSHDAFWWKVSPGEMGGETP